VHTFTTRGSVDGFTDANKPLDTVCTSNRNGTDSLRRPTPARLTACMPVTTKSSKPATESQKGSLARQIAESSRVKARYHSVMVNQQAQTQHRGYNWSIL
jgi:hypothetical protein